MFRFEFLACKHRTQLDGATQFFFWWNFFAGKIMEIGRQPPVPNPSSFYFSGVWGPRNPSLKNWEILPINYPPLPLGRPPSRWSKPRTSTVSRPLSQHHSYYTWSAHSLPFRGVRLWRDLVFAPLDTLPLGGSDWGTPHTISIYSRLFLDLCAQRKLRHRILGH